MAQLIRPEEGTSVGYAVSHEDRYLSRRAPGPEIVLTKSENGGGGNYWELMFREGQGRLHQRTPGDGVEVMRAGGVHWEIWPDDADAIRHDCAALFDALAAEQPADVEALRVILRNAGIPDATDRTRD